MNDLVFYAYKQSRSNRNYKVKMKLSLTLSLFMLLATMVASCPSCVASSRSAKAYSGLKEVGESSTKCACEETVGKTLMRLGLPEFCGMCGCDTGTCDSTC